MIVNRQHFLLLTIFLSLWAILAAPTTPPHTPSAPTKPSWILKPIETGPFTPEEEKAFSRTLHIAVGPPLNEKGNNNAGIFTVPGKYNNIDGTKLVVKALKSADAASIAEVKVLHGFDDLVDSGKVMIDGKLTPAIVMKKKDGCSLILCKEYTGAGPDDKRRMRKEAQELMYNKVADIAEAKGLYHDDNHMGNYIVTIKDKKVVSVEIIDWNGKHVYWIAKVAREVVVAHTKEEWP